MNLALEFFDAFRDELKRAARDHRLTVVKSPIFGNAPAFSWAIGPKGGPTARLVTCTADEMDSLLYFGKADWQEMAANLARARVERVVAEFESQRKATA
jgi:hypothetical protein